MRFRVLCMRLCYLARAGLEGRLFVAELVLAARILLVSVCLGRGCFVGMQHSL